MSDAPRALFASTLLVTGHPNHELPILGFVQRARPHLLFLTDGGGPRRVAESRSVLQGLGLLDRARFLNVPEGELYRALLERDTRMLAGLVGETRSMIEAVAPEQVLAESIEFYNPLHDLTLPIVRAASRHCPQIRLLEFPLIAEIPGSGGRFRVQRPPASRESAAWTMSLTEPELAVKLDAGARRYPSLRSQMGAVLEAIPREHAAVEYFLEALRGLPVPGVDCALRFEERGQTLKRAGQVDGTITLDDHFVPMVESLQRL